jgi:EmrB/QacA subfamily drug resistance transporter
MTSSLVDSRPVVTSRSLKLTIIGVAFAIFMGAVENTVAGTAMPTVIASLGGIELYSWVFAAYILAATIMTPIWGKMADLLGRRPAFFGGLACFIVGSALSGAAHSMTQLVVFRTLQGIGAAALFPVGMTIVGDLLNLEQRAKIIGVFSGMWGVASFVGPIVGGYLTQYISWRAVFYISIPFGATAWALVWMSYQERYRRVGPIGKVDYKGAIVLSLALTMLLLVVERGASFHIYQVAIAIVVVLLLALLFVEIERRSKDPLIPLDLFGIRMVGLSAFHGLFAGMCLLGSMNFLPLFVQSVHGTDAIAAGKILIPYIIPWVFGAPLGGRLLLRFGYRPVVAAGMFLIVVGAFLLAQVDVDTDRLRLSIDVAIMGLGGGLTMSSFMIGAQHAVGGARLGTTTSMVQFARSIGAALGTALMGAIMNWNLFRQIALGKEQIGALTGKDLSTLILPETRSRLSPAATTFLHQAFATSLRHAFMFALGAALVCSIVAFFVPGGSAHDLAHSEHQPEDLQAEVS